MSNAAEAIALHYNVSAARPIAGADVARAFMGADDELLFALLIDTAPETLADLQTELNLPWSAICDAVRRHLSEDHPSWKAFCS